MAMILLERPREKRYCSGKNQGVSGKLDQPAQTIEELIENYPKNLTIITTWEQSFASLGQYEKAAELTAAKNASGWRSSTVVWYDVF
jgi:predicted Zn-dependent protease